MEKREKRNRGKKKRVKVTPLILYLLFYCWVELREWGLFICYDICELWIISVSNCINKCFIINPKVSHIQSDISRSSHQNKARDLWRTFDVTLHNSLNKTSSICLILAVPDKTTLKYIASVNLKRDKHLTKLTFLFRKKNHDTGFYWWMKHWKYIFVVPPVLSTYNLSSDRGCQSNWQFPEYVDRMQSGIWFHLKDLILIVYILVVVNILNCCRK